MLFTSPEFLYVFLPVAAIVHFTVARWSPNGAAVSTTVASLFFYGWWNPLFVGLPIASMLFNLTVARAMAAAHRSDAKLL